MYEFKSGDIIQLKSGGPKMTVQKTPATATAELECQWFAGGKLEHGYFHRETIIKIEESEKRKS